MESSLRVCFWRAPTRRATSTPHTKNCSSRGLHAGIRWCSLQSNLTGCVSNLIQKKKKKNKPNTKKPVIPCTWCSTCPSNAEFLNSSYSHVLRAQASYAVEDMIYCFLPILTITTHTPTHVWQLLCLCGTAFLHFNSTFLSLPLISLFTRRIPGAGAPFPTCWASLSVSCPI